MASIRKRGKAWSVELYRHGHREHATFRTKSEAAQWALQREAELTGARLPDRTLDDALARYEREKGPSLSSPRWVTTKVRNLREHPLARKPLAAIQPHNLAAWRDERLQAVKPATVNRELNLLRSVLEAARRDWGWLRENPMADLKRPKNPPSRKRRISEREVADVVAALGYMGGEPANASQRIALAFLFALETGMRGGEIVGLRREHVREKSVHLPKTKNGDARDVPLSPRAREILALLDDDLDPVFGLTLGTKDALFRRAVQKSGVANLHFHDARSEAIWRLSKRVDVMQLAQIVGHRNVNSLLLYYRATADELADRL